MLDSDALFLRIGGDYLDLDFQYSADGKTWSTLIEGVEGSRLSPANIDGHNYTGVYVGLYGTTNGDDVGGEARFDWFDYRSTASSRDNWFYRQWQR